MKTNPLLCFVIPDGWFIEIIVIIFGGASVGFAVWNQAESGSEKPAFFYVETFFKAYCLCVIWCSAASKAWGGDKHHDYRPLQWVAWFGSGSYKRTLQESHVKVKTTHSFPMCHCCCHIALCLLFRQIKSSLRALSCPFFSSLSSPSPSWRRKYIISGDKHRKQDVLSCCESYFSYPLLPSQVQAASTSPPEQLRQLLNTTRKAASRKPTLHFPPFQSQKTTSSIFFLKQIHRVGLPLSYCWCPYL